MKLSISAESSSEGSNKLRDSASVGGEIRPLMAGIAGAVAMRNPAEVKKTEIAQKERKRRSLEGPEFSRTRGVEL